jgi:hypothetical protein
VMLAWVFCLLATTGSRSRGCLIPIHKVHFIDCAVSADH